MNIQTVNFQNLSFINVANPKEFEMKYLKNNYNFSSFHLDDFINKTQVPKIETYRDYNLIVLDFPFFGSPNGINSSQENERKKFTFSKEYLGGLPSSIHIPKFGGGTKKRRILSSYVNFFIGKDYIVVLHDDSLPAISHIFSICQQTLHNRNEFMGKGPVFLTYRIIDALVDTCFHVMNEITTTIDKIDKELEYKQSQQTLEEISNARRNIVVFHTMVKPILPLFRELSEGQYKELNGTMQSYWGNILDHLKKIWDRLEDNRELIEGISESNESLLMTKTNLTIRVLTVITVILMPLQLIGGIYGMNIVGLPFANSPWAFEIHLLMMAAIAIPLIVVFKLKRWF